MRLDEGGAGGIKPRVFPGAGDRKQLPHRIGGGDSFPFAVAAAAHAANDGVNFVAILLGVAQTFEQKSARTFAHDKAIGAGSKRAAAGGAERPDFAEFDKDGSAHVAVNAAGDGGVYFMVVEQFDGGVNGGEAGGASGVGDEVGAAHIEHIGDAPGDDVGQFAGHGIFVDGGNTLVDDAVPFLHDLLTHVAGQLLVGGGTFQGVGKFGEGDAAVGDVGLLTAHGGAHDNGRFFCV